MQYKVHLRNTGGFGKILRDRKNKGQRGKTDEKNWNYRCDGG